MELRIEDAYSWMNMQIKASKIICKELYLNERHIESICIAGHIEKEIHVHRIEDLIRIINVEYEVVPHSDEYDEMYFMYRGYKFFGLIDKEEK